MSAALNTLSISNLRQALLDLRREIQRRGTLWLVWQVLLTLLAVWLIVRLFGGALAWMLSEARWEVIAANLRLLSIGAYPKEEAWRPAAALVWISLMIGLSAGRWGRLVRNFALLLLAIFGGLLISPFAAPLFDRFGASSVAALLSSFTAGRVLLLQTTAALLGAWILAGRKNLDFLRSAGEQPKAKRAEIAAGGSGWWLRSLWLLSIPILFYLLRGGGGLSYVAPREWGGLLLTLVLAATAILISFPFGVLLAIGRRSQLPLIKLLSVLFIELVRGVPLITLLFMSDILAPLLFPDGLQPDDVLRAIIGLTFFAAAYAAEDVRGGLAAVGAGQEEAAQALGLGKVATYRLIVLPQALRTVIPAIVGQFISLFKDTSLAIIIGLRELLGIARNIIAQPEFIGLYRESMTFIALIFFVFSFAMSRAATQLEADLGVDSVELDKR